MCLKISYFNEDLRSTNWYDFKNSMQPGAHRGDYRSNMRAGSLLLYYTGIGAGNKEQ